MINLNIKIKNKIKKHALEKSPEECCGLLVISESDIDVLPCENKADNKKDYFEISGKDYLNATKKGEVVAFYHSHTHHVSEFSNFDKFISDIHSLPAILYSTKDDTFRRYFPA